MTKKDKGRKLKIMIVDDEEDNLVLYRDYLYRHGHNVDCCYLDANNIMTNFEKNVPDVCLMDFRLHGNKNGLDAADEILDKYPTTSIIFITGDELLSNELSKHPILQDKNIEVLIKPVRLDDMEAAVLKSSDLS